MPFSSLPIKDFFGRQIELPGLYKRVLLADKGQAYSAVLCGRRGVGKTELLRHLFTRLFLDQDRVVPFLYTVNPALLSLPAFSGSYLIRFICQRLAFEGKDQSLLYRDGTTIDGLSTLAEEQGAFWAQEVLDRYAQCAGDPLEALRIALLAPHHSTLSTGLPVAVLIDDFHRLKELRPDGVPDHRMVSLFQEPMSHARTPHVITGNMAELLEMAVVGGLERLPVPPLGPEAASSMVNALLEAYETEGKAPPLLLRHLGGNPSYIGRVVSRARAKKDPEDRDFWNAYIQEIMEGTLALSWLTALKAHFPGLGQRRTALAIVSRLFHTTGALSCERIAKLFSLTEARAQEVLHALYLAGFVRGEFGSFRAMDDRVLRDIVDALTMREVLEKSPHEVEAHFLEALVPQKGEVVRFDLALSMAGEAELIVAQSLEQIGKNLDLDQEAVGQLQIAVIEACINAAEHGRGMDDKVFISVSVDGDQVEVSVESAGQEFIIQETGEPFRGGEAGKRTGRGWGIKLIKRFVDHVRFEKTVYGTKIILVKKIERSAGMQREEGANRE